MSIDIRIPPPAPGPGKPGAAEYSDPSPVTPVQPVQQQAVQHQQQGPGHPAALHEQVRMVEGTEQGADQQHRQHGPGGRGGHRPGLRPVGARYLPLSPA